MENPIKVDDLGVYYFWKHPSEPTEKKEWLVGQCDGGMKTKLPLHFDRQFFRAFAKRPWMFLIDMP